MDDSPFVSPNVDEDIPQAPWVWQTLALLAVITPFAVHVICRYHFGDGLAYHIVAINASILGSWIPASIAIAIQNLSSNREFLLLALAFALLAAVTFLAAYLTDAVASMITLSVNYESTLRNQDA